MIGLWIHWSPMSWPLPVPMQCCVAANSRFDPPGPLPVALLQCPVVQSGTAEVTSPQVRAMEPAAAQVGPTQGSPVQAGETEVCSLQIGSVQTGLAEIGALQLRSLQIRIAEIGMHQISISQAASGTAPALQHPHQIVGISARCLRGGGQHCQDKQ